MSIQDIPALNATLNAIATVLMSLGFVFIKRGNRTAHRVMMVSAGVVSAVFLIFYVAHKILVRGVHTPFGGEGAIRLIYFGMLVSHIILAIAIAYLVPKTFSYAFKGEYDTHRRWARFTFPIWYYVSITGVLIYFFLYRWWPKLPA